MRIALIAFYAGPDQVMTVTSGLASILGVLLIFWHKVVAAFRKIVNKFRRTPATTTPPGPQKDAQNS
jgi:undecaprenyl pyrophosphate phosphatase UppP